MKLQPTALASFLAKPPQKPVAFLVFGHDEGLISATAKEVITRMKASLGADTEVTEFTAELLKDDPALLGDELSAFGMFGGKVVVVQGAGDALAETLLDAIAKARASGYPLVVTGSGLTTKSKLVKAFEAARDLVCLPCYQQEGADLSRVLREKLAAMGLGCEPDALSYLTRALEGGDMGVALKELEKLTLYVGESRQITLADVEAVTQGAPEHRMDDLTNAVADGDVRRADTVYHRLLQEGLPAVVLLRAVSGYFLRLYEAAAKVQAGSSPQEAVQAMRPPMFFKQQPLFLKHLRAWPLAQLKTALAQIQAAEARLKTTGMPEVPVGGMALFNLARLARKA